MKKLFVLFLLFSTFSGYTQECPTPDQSNRPDTPIGTIDRSKAEFRIRIYRGNKNYNPKIHIDSLVFEPHGFLQMLKDITAMSRQYNGLRAYFAVDTSKKNELTLVFVPTKRDKQGRFRINLDDTSKCYGILNNKVQRLTSRDASNYVRAFQNNHLPGFTSNGQTHFGNEAPRRTDTFYETKSIWYDISMFEEGTDENGHTGLVTYLQCLINSSKVDSIVANFAGFEHGTAPKNYDYQLTLIFDFKKKDITNEMFAGNNTIEQPKDTILMQYIKEKYLFDKDKKLFFDKKDKTLFAKKEFLLSLLKMFAKDYTDTGVPCPPPPMGSSSCPGTLLPEP